MATVNIDTVYQNELQASASNAAADAAHATKKKKKGDKRMRGLPFKFPAFRSSEWIESEDFQEMKVPYATLEGIQMNPAFMNEFPTSALFPGKVARVKDQMRRYLFRQAVAKVQNVEVTHLDSCKEDRILLEVFGKGGGKMGKDALSKPGFSVYVFCFVALFLSGRHISTKSTATDSGSDGFVYPDDVTGLRNFIVQLLTELFQEDEQWNLISIMPSCTDSKTLTHDWLAQNSSLRIDLASGVLDASFSNGAFLLSETYDHHPCLASAARHSNFSASVL